MEDIIGSIAATLTTVAFIPQAVKVIRDKDTEALSLSMYVIFTAGIALWLIYGLMLMSWPIIIANIVTLPLSSTILAIKWRNG